MAKAAFFPRFTLSLLGGYESGGFANLLSWPSHFWSLGPALAQTLFAGGSLQALTDQARAAYDGAVASYRQTVLTGFQEVEDNVAALRILEREALVQDGGGKGGAAIAHGNHEPVQGGDGELSQCDYRPDDGLDE